MKQSHIGLILLCAVIATVMSCNKARGPIAEEELFLPPFTGVEHVIRDNVYITQGSPQQVVIEGQNNVISQLNRNIVHGVWKIDFIEKPRQYKNMKIHITLPDIRYVGLSGPGIITSKNTWRCDSLYLSVRGSGYIDIDAQIHTLYCSMEKNGDIFLKGDVDKEYFIVSGSGRINAFDMAARECWVTITGSGNADVAVKERLCVHITGSGSVHYAGNPTLDTIMEGGGEVRKIR